MSYGNRAEFWYGDAKFPGGESDAWTPPLRIEIFPYCSYAPEKFVSYMESLKEYGIDSGEFSSIRVEDADGYLKRYSDSDESLYMWSGDNTINLSTYSIELHTEEAARALTGLNGPAANALPAATTKSCPTER